MHTGVLASSGDAAQRSAAIVAGSCPPNASGNLCAAATQDSSEEHPANVPSTCWTVSDPGSIAIAWANASSHVKPAPAEPTPVDPVPHADTRLVIAAGTITVVATVVLIIAAFLPGSGVVAVHLDGMDRSENAEVTAVLKRG